MTKTPYGVEDDNATQKTAAKAASGKSPFAVEDEDDEESKKPSKEYTPQKPFATSNDAFTRPSTKVRKPPGGESHILF